MQKPFGSSHSNRLPRTQFKGFLKHHHVPTMSSNSVVSGPITGHGALPQMSPSFSRESDVKHGNLMKREVLPVCANDNVTESKESAAVQHKDMRTMAIVPKTSVQQTEMKTTVEVVPKMYQAATLPDEEEASSSEAVSVEKESLDKERKIKRTESEMMIESNIKIQTSTELYQKTSSIQKKSEDRVWYTREFVQHMKSIYLSYQKFKSFSLSVARYGRGETAKALLKSGNVFVMCDLILEVFESGKFASEDSKLAKNHSLVLQRALLVLVNFSDCSDEVCYTIRDHDHILPAILRHLTACFPAHQAKELSASQEEIVKLCLSVIHNVSMREDSMTRLQELKASHTLLPYLQSRKDAFKLSALASLADLVSEEEADQLSASPNIAAFLLKRLEKAFEAKNHRCYGWSVTELVRAVRRLARNDANKRLLVDQGVLSLLAKGIKSRYDDEKHACMEALWVLSFDKNNVKEMMNHAELLDDVIHFLDDQSQPAHFANSVHGLLFQLRDQLMTTEKYRNVGERFYTKKRRPARDGKETGQTAAPAMATEVTTTHSVTVSTKVAGIGHVMLSYQWANQDVVKQIRNCLQDQGFKVWMDIDDMGGSTLQAMATAIEESYLVVLCMSQKYKDSPNCRAEAEYAFQKRKNIIPLIMQKGYRPDGWLGFILGSKLFYDFSGKYSFESRISQLMKAMQEVTNSVSTAINGGHTTKVQAIVKNTVDTAEQNHAVAAVAPTPVYCGALSVTDATEVSVKSWTAADVKKWLKNFGLDGTQLENLTGREIFFLHNLRREAPEFFYNTLEKKLQITTLSGLMDFTDALGSLSSST